MVRLFKSNYSSRHDPKPFRLSSFELQPGLCDLQLRSRIVSMLRAVKHLAKVISCTIRQVEK